MHLSKCCFACVAMLFLALLAQAQSLTRGPYLGRPDDSSMAVVWRTDIPADSRVDYALVGANDWQTVRKAEVVTTHKVRLDGLLPGGLYRYQVYSNELLLGPQGWFRAPRGPEESEFTFAVIGDTNRRWIPEIIARHLADAAPDFAIHTGDVVYPAGSDDLYDEEFFGPFAPFLLQAPVLPTLGNHDAFTDRGAPLLANFVLPGSRFYSFRHANALFVSVDVETSSFGGGSLQYEWLSRTLAGSDADWKLVYLHEPPYSSDRSNALVRIILGPLFERHGVDVVFSGSAHLYERTLPICDFGWPGCRGVVYITEGGGGAALSNFRRQKFSAVVIARHGYTIGAVSGGRLTLTSHDLEAAVVDSLVLEKGSAPRRLRAVR